MWEVSRHARGSNDPTDPRHHISMCNLGYPWPNDLAFERPNDPDRQVSCKACLKQIELRTPPANPIPTNASDS